VTVLETVAAILLILGSVMVLRTVFLADRALEDANRLEPSGQEPEAPSLGRAA
jgi:hypothetical protein